MCALKSVMAAGFAALLVLSGCGDTGGAAGAGGAAGDAGAGGAAGGAGLAGTAGVAGTGGVVPSSPQAYFVAYCEKLAYCQPAAIPYIFEPLEPEVFLERCAASFGTMAGTAGCFDALALFWACAAAEDECDPRVCDAHLPSIDEACR